MNLADALKKLYTKLGGTDALPQGTDTCTLVDKIADEVSGGGSSGGGGALYIPIVETETETQYVYTLSGYTYNRVMGAIENGKSIYATTYNKVNDAVEVLPLYGYSPVTEEHPCLVYVQGASDFRFTATTQDDVLTFVENRD